MHQGTSDLGYAEKKPIINRTIRFTHRNNLLVFYDSLLSTTMLATFILFLLVKIY